jgi:predicted PurR-regulated permease PerM
MRGGKETNLIIVLVLVLVLVLDRERAKETGTSFFPKYPTNHHERPGSKLSFTQFYFLLLLYDGSYVRSRETRCLQS